MDLFDYAQALFNEQEDLWVPALGHFYKMRKSSYYDAETNTLHPPCYRVVFEQKLDNNDNNFIAYFSKVKNLSFGSAKYFIDKFVENIKEELQHREVNFAFLGILYTDNASQISFKGNELNRLENGGLYGLAPVQMPKLTAAEASTDEPLNETIPEIIESNNTETVSTQKTIEPIPGKETKTDLTEDPETAEVDKQPKKRAYDPNNFYTDDRILVLKGKPRHIEKSTRYQFWVLAGLVAVVVILGVYLVTQDLLDPNNNSDVSGKIMDKSGGRKDTVVNLSKVKNDSILKLSQDIKTIPAVVDTTGVGNTIGTNPTAPKTALPDANAKLSPELPLGSWVVSGGQNNNYDAAVRTVNKFRSMGYAEARMIDSVKKKDYFVYKIIFGYYSTRKEAAEARILLLKENKLKPKVLKVQQYK